MTLMRSCLLKKVLLLLQTKYLTDIKRRRLKIETINYVDDTNRDAVRENKNAKIAAKEITEKYKRLARKRKIKPTPTAVVTDGFRNPSKKRKGTTKSTIIAARDISKKYKNLRHR